MAMRKTTTMEQQEEIVRLLAVQLRRTAKSQTEAIVELGRAGFSPSRISELLGTTPNTVSQVLSEMKKKKPTRKKNHPDGTAPEGS